MVNIIRYFDIFILKDDEIIKFKYFFTGLFLLGTADRGDTYFLLLPDCHSHEFDVREFRNIDRISNEYYCEFLFL